jgi:hypothetical protein
MCSDKDEAYESFRLQFPERAVRTLHNQFFQVFRERTHDIFTENDEGRLLQNIRL